MNELSRFSDNELRAEIDRRTRQAKNAAGFVRCKDCCQPEACKYAQRRLKQGVWRICKDFLPNN